MTIGVSLFLIALGAILRWGVTTVVEGARLDVIGLILMAVGAAGLVLGLIVNARGGRRVTHESVRRGPRGEERVVEDREL